MEFILEGMYFLFCYLKLYLNNLCFLGFEEKIFSFFQNFIFYLVDGANYVQLSYIVNLIVTIHITFVITLDEGLNWHRNRDFSKFTSVSFAKMVRSR